MRGSDPGVSAPAPPMAQPTRLDYQELAPEATAGLTELSRFVRSGSLPKGLVELVKIRASQINECAYCLDIHLRKARRFQVPERQLDTLAGWRESTVFSAKERAALAWTEGLTTLLPDRVPDPLWEATRREFTERELVELTIAIVEINAWNRLQVAFRRPPEFTD